MTLLAPLIQLRGEWRQAAAISVPSAAGPVAEALDNALDLLQKHDQLDRESLAMAVDVVCRAVVARPDEVELLRMRLLRAVEDYELTAAVDTTSIGDFDGAAFESEEALAAALFAAVDADAVSEETAAATGVTPPASSRRHLDERALARGLANRPGQGRRILLGALRILLPLVVLGGVLLYVLAHPELLVHQQVIGGSGGPPPQQSQSGNGATQRSGTFEGTTALCTDGTSGPSSCSWSFDVSAAGAVTLIMRWDTGDALAIHLVDAAGHDIVPPATGQDGKVLLSAPNVPVGRLSFKVVNVAHAPGPIHFSIATQ